MPNGTRTRAGLPFSGGSTELADGREGLDGDETPPFVNHRLAEVGVFCGDHLPGPDVGEVQRQPARDRTLAQQALRHDRVGAPFLTT